jgi:hypothetical protein
VLGNQHDAQSGLYQVLKMTFVPPPMRYLYLLDSKTNFSQHLSNSTFFSL